MSTTNNKTALEKILEQYNKNQQPTNTGKKTYDLKNYFSPRLGEKEKSGSKRIRIIPGTDGGTPFTEVYIHKLQINGEWKKFICLNHNFDKACPFCEAREALLATGKETDKELAKTYGSKRAYVVKVVDRDAEDEGVKFWRFNHDYRNEGILDKIIGIIKNRGEKGDISNPETGRDLIIEMGKNQTNKTIIKSIVDADPAPLSDDQDLAKEWLSDARTWEDVYSLKSYEYLEIVVTGGEPTWDKAKGKWVDKAELADVEAADIDEAITMGGQGTEKSEAIVEEVATPKAEKAAKAPKAVKAAVTADEDEDDLPF